MLMFKIQKLPAWAKTEEPRKSERTTQASIRAKLTRE